MKRSGAPAAWGAPLGRRSHVVGGRYRLGELIGRTPQSLTYAAEDVVSGARVVVKVTPAASVTAEAAARLEHEAAVLRSLGAPEVCPLVAVGRDGDLAYLVTPFVAGTPLAVRLQRGALPLRDMLTVGRSVLRGLAHIHAHDVLHGDVKPGNVIVAGEATVDGAVLVGLGLTRSDALDPSLRDRPVGTARYVSPEQAGLLDCRPDGRSDLYSTGILLFECLAGRPPYEAHTVGELLRQHLSASPPALGNAGVPVPRALEELVQRLVRKDPQDRYQSAEGALADLQEIADAIERDISDPPVVIGLRDRRRTLTEAAFVGRTTEIARLDAATAAAAEGRGGLALVEGESGSGKSRLLDELARRCTTRGLWMLRGQAVDRAAPRPLQILAGVAEGVSADPAWAAAIRSALGAHVPAAAHALPALAGLLHVEADESLGPEDFGEERTLDALSAFLSALGSAERPAVVVLDDCQWADALAVDLLARWARSTSAARHVTVVAAFRSEEVAQGHALRRVHAATRVRLLPFGLADVRLLTESMAGPLPPPVVRLVHNLSGGNPFMASAVLRGLVESGALVDEPSGWRLEGDALGDVQSSQEAARFLERRLELLPQPTLRLLSVGALLGKSFDVGAAAELAGASPDDGLAMLREASQRRIVWIHPGGDRCSFVHDKLREALLDRLSVEDSRALHRLAARRFERLQPDAVFELAYHFDAAGDPVRALPSALAAGAQARTQHALEVAERQYRIAVRGAAAADDALRRQAAQGLGEILMLRGRYDEAGQRLAEAAALATEHVARAQIEAQRGELAFKRGDVRAGAEALERALHLLGHRVPRRNATFVARLCGELATQLLHTLFPRFFRGRGGEADDTTLLALHIHSRLAYAYWFARGVAACGWAHLREMNLAERHGAGPAMAQAYSEHAPVTTMVPLFGRGIAYGERSLALRRAAHDVWGEGQSLHFSGVVLYAASRYKEAMSRCREAAALLEQTGDRWEMNTANWHVAYCLYRLGRLEDAVAAARAVHRAGLEIGDAQATGISLSVWAKASLGQVPAELIDAEISRGSEDGHTAAEVLQAQALNVLFDGRPEDAAEILRRAQALVKAKALRQEYVAPILPWLATALRQAAATAAPLAPRRRARQVRQAAGAARRARRRARLYRNNLPHALRESGYVAALQGRTRRARRYFDRALREAAEQSAAWEQAETLRARGQVGLEAGWSDAEADVAAAARMAPWTVEPLRVPDAAPGRPATLSLVDRFDTLLHDGRQIASALTPEAVFAAVRDAAVTLLRGERCIVLAVSEDRDVAAVSGELDGELDEPCQQLAREVTASRRAATLDGAGHARSALCAPILVRDRVIGAFYVSHTQVSGLFGREEERLAEFIATLAGAALENAEGFAEVQALTRTLEDRVTERTAQLADANRELAHQAFHDPLTGLANRLLFRDRVEHTLRLRQRSPWQLAVLLLDLDDFKHVNDTWGHAAGDELLRAVAQRLRACLRPSDTIARLGGDEFAVLLEDPEQAAEAVSVAERIVRDLLVPFRVQETDLWVHASVGIAVGTGSEGADELFRQADAAMYAAKEGGKARVAVFEPRMLAAVADRGRLRADLQRVVEEEGEHEFVLHYQPIVDLDSGLTRGVEALVRWRRSELELVPPSDFIPFAEAAGFIVPIGRWVLEGACDQAARWQRDRPRPAPLDVHVNLSARQLHEPELVRDVANLLEATNLAPGSLVLEITESVLLRDAAATTDHLRALRGLGVRVALDDFGTGYSSLAYLQRFPIDILKIDKCFIDGLGNGAPSPLVHAVVQLGHALELDVVAEGVERPEQAQELRALGCRLGQGHLWSQPRTAHELEPWVHAHDGRWSSPAAAGA